MHIGYVFTILVMLLYHHYTVIVHLDNANTIPLHSKIGWRGLMQVWAQRY